MTALLDFLLRLLSAAALTAMVVLIRETIRDLQEDE